MSQLAPKWLTNALLVEDAGTQNLLLNNPNTTMLIVVKGNGMKPWLLEGHCHIMHFTQSFCA
jgi:hypothetical protein